MLYRKWIRRSAFAVGVALLVLTIVGRFGTLLPDQIDALRDPFGKSLEMSLDEVRAVIDSDATDKTSYLERLNTAIHKGVLHHWSAEHAKETNLTIPATENFILYGMQFVWPEDCVRYEFFDYRRALDRRLGSCGQKSILLVEILKEKRIPGHVFQLGTYVSPRGRSDDGHIVAAVEVGDDEWWVADPDFGVIVPHSPEQVGDNPTLVSRYYEEAGYPEGRIKEMETVFEKDKNVVKDRYVGAKGYSVKKYYFEKSSYVFIWLIPLALMSPTLWGLSRQFLARTS